MPHVINVMTCELVKIRFRGFGLNRSGSDKQREQVGSSRSERGDRQARKWAGWMVHEIEFHGVLGI